MNPAGSLVAKTDAASSARESPAAKCDSPFCTPGPCADVLSRIAGRKTNRPSANARALQPEIVSWTSENALALLRLYGTAQPELLTDRDLCTLLYEEKTSRLACLMLCCKKAFRVLLWREKQVKTQQVQVPDQQPWKGACVDFETKV